jgi:hypothetical protein
MNCTLKCKQGNHEQSMSQHSRVTFVKRLPALIDFLLTFIKMHKQR